MTLEELTALENEWLAKQPWHGSAEQRHDLYERIGMYDAWRGIFRGYAILAKEGDLEALKRALFLCWYNISEPEWLTGLMILDAGLIREVYGLVNDLARRGGLDGEFTWMLPYYYSVAEWYLPPTFGALLKASRRNQDLYRRGCLESSFEQRGQLGQYWASIQTNLKNHDPLRDSHPTVVKLQSRRARRDSRRFCSLPGLRWRDRIKAFERDVYDRWADGIDRSVWAPWCDHWVRSFIGEIPESSAVLDVGSGTGRALRIMTARRPSLLAGIDISPVAFAAAMDKLAHLGADLRVGDVEVELPWPDATFDVATMTAVLHHLPQPERLLHHVRRVLKPQGRLIVAEPHFFFPILQIENLLLRIYPINGDLHFLSQRGLRRLLARCGFQTLAQRRAAFFARYTVAQRCNGS